MGIWRRSLYDSSCGGAGWKDFAFQFRRTIGTAGEEVREILDVIKEGKDLDWLRLLAGLADLEEKKLGADLCAIFRRGYVSCEGCAMGKGEKPGICCL